MRVLFLALALSGAPAFVQEAAPVSARFECEPSTVEVGEPFELVLELDHPVSTGAFEIGDADLALDDTWVVFGRRLEAPRRLADGDRAVTRRVWTLASLDPGTRRLAETVTALVADERVASVDASGASVEVLGVLAPEEDAPRPPRLFPAGFGRPLEGAPSPWRWAAAAAAALFWAGVLWLVVRRLRRRKGRAAATVAPPLERLAQLRAEPAATPDAVRARHFELTHLVRGALDERLARPAQGWTDAEWLADLEHRSRFDAELKRELAALIEEAEAVKYAGSLPTSWALEESYARARRALDAIEAGGVETLVGAGHGEQVR